MEIGPHFDGSNHWVNVFGLVEQQWMAVMTMSFLETLAANAREPAPALQPLGLLELVRERARAALERRRLRRAAARLVLNEHLRRDVGLPPFIERRW